MSETRNRLLDATRRCVAERGLAGTTSRHITAEAEVNLAAITYHFGSKDQLVAAALLDALTTWLGPTLDVLRGGGDPAVRTLAAIQTLVTTFAEHRDDAPVFLQALVEAPRMAPLAAGVASLWGELRGLLSGHMADMRRRGELPAWVEPEAMAGLLVAVASGLVLQATVEPDGPALETMAGQFGHLLLAARTPAPPARPRARRQR